MSEDTTTRPPEAIGPSEQIEAILADCCDDDSLIGLGGAGEAGYFDVRLPGLLLTPAEVLALAGFLDRLGWEQYAEPLRRVATEVKP